mgnify:CR=1 FL=1
MEKSRFHTLAAVAALGVTAGCASPAGDVEVSRAATPEPVMTGMTTPGQAYLREITIGAADGMKIAGWSDSAIERRVDQVRAEADLFRYEMPAFVQENYDAVRRSGYAQGLMGEWSPDALEGYLDVIEVGGQRFTAIEVAAHSDYAWSAPYDAISGVMGVTDGVTEDRAGHAVAATVLASEINVASAHVSEMILEDEVDAGRVPAIEVGDRLTYGQSGPSDRLQAYADVIGPPEEEAFDIAEGPS